MPPCTASGELMKLRQGLVVAAVSLLAGAAWAQADVAYDRGPDWAKKPTPDDLLAVWPKAAFSKGKGGKATISCKVSRAGALYGCTIVSESPAGAGFGDAAIALTPQFLMRPAMRGGQPVDGAVVRIPLNFPDFTPVNDDGFGSSTVLSIGRWTEAPTYAQVAAAYPEKARAKAVGGHVALNCTLKADGHLQYCHTISALPAGLGFEGAAKKLADYFVGPLTLEGKTTKGMITQVAFAFMPAMLAAAEPEIGKAHWTATPTGEQMYAVLPPNRDKIKATTVRVRLSCLVVAGGKVDDCKIVSEDPAGEGFAASALAVSKFFELSIWSQDGLPTVGGRVLIPVRYELGDLPAPAKPKGP
jgi:TonB family protein